MVLVCPSNCGWGIHHQAWLAAYGVLRLPAELGRLAELSAEACRLLRTQEPPDEAAREYAAELRADR